LAASFAALRPDKQLADNWVAKWLIGTGVLPAKLAFRITKKIQVWV